ncbi:hypothetical protein PORY_001366 [Pneumocystis oryctolagi]|uniref:Uncharacterized protein n=1 Tax=Pneumocystis oryctolagi TaxID=42067 RepID=A0ACB7CC44_9ASCO|nr:hypothetical protein PORY_001366 [Pneumocystis oryctolagi]
MKVENDSQIIKQKKYNKVVEKKCIESKNQVKKAFQVQGSSEDCHLDNDYISMVGQSFKKELEKKSVFNKRFVSFV